ncbi:MAG: single-stranded-DNA-specific exonuclease RecJ [Candidatus Omnitrophica bacterium]|jgi:single-stranded-DNA-specific exonuclease|nr:single-stranded-DNA-specific exonuclease RecJ [Candidatus Omnitrophota bacterium]
MKRRIWKIKEFTPQVKDLSQKYNISVYLAQILLNRAIDEKQFPAFLNHSIEFLHSFSLLPDIKKASQRVKKAIEKKEKILIVGDYDVDGVTSLAIFNEFVKEHRELFSFYIPHRVNDGYGLNTDVIERAKKENQTLIIAFDCGTNSLKEIELACSYGIDTIVIDHHHPSKDLNKAYAFINPKRTDSDYPFKDLSAAALAFKFLQALTKKDCKETLDLVALSLVCDVVPLKGENRVLLKEGLKMLRVSRRPAIEALCKVAKIKQENINTFHIGYILGPRINASGRVASANDSLEMFLSKDLEEVLNIASRLQEYNLKRKAIEMNILKEAEQKIEQDSSNDYAIVVSGENWHSGVLGIVASRLVDKYYRPSFVISFDDILGRGSARSIHSVHLMEALENCGSTLCAYGGHKKAAGLEIFREGLEEFRQRINLYIKNNTKPTDLIPILDIDLKLNFNDVTIELIEELNRLEPFGEENPKPMFASYSVYKKSKPKKINSGYTVWLSDGEKTLEGIIYDRGLLEIIEYAEEFDMAYSLEKNGFHNEPLLVIRDIALSGSKI